MAGSTRKKRNHWRQQRWNSVHLEYEAIELNNQGVKESRVYRVVKILPAYNANGSCSSKKYHHIIEPAMPSSGLPLAP